MIHVTDQRRLEQAEILFDAFVQYRTRYRVKLAAPLAEWETHSSFDSVTDCKVAQEEELEIAEHAAEHGNCRTKTECDVFVTQAKMAKCMGTDDPRLKER
jgi:hypothetical protein